MTLAGALTMHGRLHPLPQVAQNAYTYLTFQTFTLSNISKMYFSDTDETTDIEEMTSDVLDEAISIYDLQGHQITKEQMRKGVYIVKTKSKTQKILVK